MKPAPQHDLMQRNLCVGTPAGNLGPTEQRATMNRYAKFGEPQDVLDFHGRGPIGGAAVKRDTIDFVRRAKAQGMERLRIVTGKGVHSQGAPVVRPQVERTLKQLEEEGLVASYRPERVGSGGDGAFFVRL